MFFKYFYDLFSMITQIFLVYCSDNKCFNKFDSLWNR